MDQNGTKILHKNVRNLYTNLVHVTSLLNFYKHIDIFTLTETHITQEPKKLFEIPGYTFVSRSRRTGKGGGVGMYISNDIRYDRRLDLENDKIECIWIEVLCKSSKNFLVCCMYRPPSGSRYLPDDLNDQLHDMLSLATRDDKEIIMLGDVNVNYLVKDNNKDFKEILNLLGLKQLVKEATRICDTTKTLIDIIASNKPELIRCTEVFPSDFSDHELIGCIRKLNHLKFQPKEIKCRDYSRYNHEEMNRDILNADWSDVYNTNDVNTAWNAFYQIAYAIFDQYAPLITKRVKSKPAPWLTPQIKAVMNDRDKLMRKYRKSKSDFDKREYQNKRNRVNILLRKAKTNYSKELLRENSNDPESFWKTLKLLYPVSSKENPRTQPFEINGEKSTDEKEIVKGFKTFFSNIVYSIKSKAMPFTDFIWSKPSEMICKTYKTFRFKKVTPTEVCGYLRKLQRKKATGCDGLPASFLKDSKDSIKNPLCHIINLSIVNGIVPTEWKTARIVPIHKSGSRTLFDNYRPISILPTISKIIEKIVHKQLVTFLEENKLIYRHQFGFRSHMSTEQAATLFLDSIRLNVDKGNLVGACFIDLSKAFDTISHSKLLAKLPKYGIHDRELDWFTDYLFGRKAIVQFDQTQSDDFVMCSGVPQGSILGPLLFLIIFNDLTDVIKHSKVIKYADDTVLYVSAKSATEISNKLTDDLTTLSKWFDDNELIMNLKKGKTEALLFGTPQKVSKQFQDFDVYVNTTKISITKDYKYLGVPLDSSLNMNTFFDKCYKKASSRLNLLAKLRNELDTNAAKSIYQSMIMPTFTYCGLQLLCLTNTQAKKMESFHKRAERIVNTNDENRTVLQSISNANKKRACAFVKLCLDDEVMDSFKQYFVLCKHNKNTRNNAKMIRLPNIKTEYARKSFYFTGAKIYNTLPLEARSLQKSEFSNFIKEYFK